MNKALHTWTPAVSLRRPDNIISSKAREQNNRGITPSYLKEKNEDMWLIMSNDYMRKWFKERGVYEKYTYTREQIIREESKIKRRFVQKMMTYKRPGKNDWIDKSIRSKLSKNEQPSDSLEQENMKYKPLCRGEMNKLTEKPSVNENKENGDNKCDSP